MIQIIPLLIKYRHWLGYGLAVAALVCSVWYYPKTTIHGHREFADKACPSFDVQEWLKGTTL